MEIIYYILFIIINWLGLFFISYVKKKGENYATKEDIEEITRKIEKVKNEYVEQKEYQIKCVGLRESLIKIKDNYAITLFYLALIKWGLEENRKAMEPINNICSANIKPANEFITKNIVYFPENIRDSVNKLIDLGNGFNGEIVNNLVSQEKLMDMHFQHQQEIKIIIADVEKLIYESVQH